VTFGVAALGTLPTHAGLVWTDGSGPIQFEAFDALGGSLGIIDASHADGSSSGTTAEDRFYGVTNAGGISSITIRNGGGIEADHVQYGTLQDVVTVPEAGTLPLLGGALGLCAGAFVVRRRKSA
ncbi:MAG: PEP-CTERM sorting domain-containing protein, partial [Fibrella sp.]|nr:PEP-CTERM sorting domain-containing protein [Armatimonadota bacterium]